MKQQQRTMAASQEESAWEEAASQNRIVLPNVDVTDKEEFNELCGLLGVRGVAAKSRLRMYVQQLQPAQEQRQQPSESAFLVGALVRGAKQSNGARGNVFKFLERDMGHYSKQEGIQIYYEQDNLTVKAYFISYDSACRFQTALNEWEIHKELANLDGVMLDPLTPVRIDKPADLARIYLQDYTPQDSESPCRSIDQLHSYRLSIPPTTEVAAASPLGQYQCLDKQVVGYNPYKCHLKDKAKFKSLQSNENNLVAASWQLHQLMDGLNSIDGIPGVAVSVVNMGNERSAEHDGRIMVRLNLEFRNKYLAGLFQGNDMPLRVDDTNWQVTVYVEDSATFCDCVQWKHADTKKQWKDHEKFLNTV